MYESFYGLNEKPFHIVPNPNYLYLSPKHQNALTHLEYGLMERVGFILLTGEIGTGKTTLVHYLLNQIESDMEVGVIFNTNVSSDQLLNLILSEFELTAEAGDKVKALDIFYQFLIEKYAEDKRVLLIIDEAQNLSHESLEEVRMLSNLQSDEEMLLQIMLVGQSELKEKLRNPALAQFTQRIAVNYHLTALPEEDTGRYIAYRLEKAGGRPDIFTTDAVGLVHQASTGIPRSINLLCDAALTYGYADELETIDAQVIEQVIKDKGGFGIQGEEEEKKEMDHAPTAHTQGKNDKIISHRINKLEAEVRKLGEYLEKELKERKQHKSKQKDEHVEKLKKLLFRERKRSAVLLTKYSHLRERYLSLYKTFTEFDKGRPAPLPSRQTPPGETPVKIDPSILLPTDLEFPSDDKDFKL